MSLTLSLYIARRFLGALAFAFASVFAVVVIVDLAELMRAGAGTHARFGDFLAMAVLHAPSLMITAAPFTVMLAAMLCFAMLARSGELVVTRAAGVSVWRILAPALLVAFGLGVVTFSVVDPISAAMATRFAANEEQLFHRDTSRLSIASGGLWLRQGGPQGQTVIRAQRTSSAGDRLWRVSVFQFDPQDRLSRRIDAKAALLTEGAWRLTGVREWNLLALTGAEANPMALKPLRLDELRIPTDLTLERIRESFAPPETISFWKLPGFIRLLDQAGFSSSRHRMHWLGLLALPVLFCAMLLLGAAFSMRHLRFGGLGLMALGCVLTGFGYFFLSDIATALGASGAVPVPIAAWAPPISAVLLSLGLLLHLEDG